MNLTLFSVFHKPSVTVLNMMTDSAGFARLSTVLPPHEASSSTSWQVSRGQDAGSDEKHVSIDCIGADSTGAVGKMPQYLLHNWDKSILSQLYRLSYVLMIINL